MKFLFKFSFARLYYFGRVFSTFLVLLWGKKIPQMKVVFKEREKNNVFFSVDSFNECVEFSKRKIPEG